MTAAPASPHPRRRLRAWLLAAGALFFLGFASLGALYLYLRVTRRPVSAPASPAPAITSISPEQGQRLVEELAKYPAHSLTVKTDPSDRTANQLAHQLYDLLRTTQWHVDLSTDTTGPPIGTGLCLAETGEAVRPPYPEMSQDPYFYLPAAFSAAHIGFNSESGQSSGDYKLYLVIGHRDVNQPGQSHGYVLRAAARWLLRHLKALRSS